MTEISPTIAGIPLTFSAQGEDALDRTIERENEAGFRNSETSKNLEEQGVDSKYLLDRDKPPPEEYEDIDAFDAWAAPPGYNPNFPNTIQEEQLVDPKTSYGQNMRDSGLIVANYLRTSTAQRPIGSFGESPTGGQIDTISDSVSTESKVRGFAEATTPLDTMSDRDAGQFMLEFLGQNEHNIGFATNVFMDTKNMPPEVLASIAGTLDLYDKLPNFTWSGTKRLTKGLFTDLSTYVGLSSLKGVKTLLEGGSKLAGKKILRDQMLNKLLGSAFVGVEGAGYAVMMDLFKQKSEAGDNPFVYNKEQGLLAAGIGFAAGGALTAGMVNAGAIAKGAKAAGGAILDAGATAAGKLGEFADTMIPAPGQLSMGVGPVPKPNQPMTFGGAAAEGSRAHKVPHQLLVEGTGEKADLPVTQAFSPANKQANFQNIDAVHQTNPDALKTSDGWLTAMQRGLGGEFLITPPNQAIKYANDPQLMADKLSKLTPELKAGVDKGFKHVQGIRNLYQSGQATEEMTGGLFVWGILSRGAGPVQQEAAFLNIIEGARPFIKKAIDGSFDEKTLIKWQKTIGKYGEVNNLPEGSPSKSVTMNVNAAGKLLLELSGTAGNGQNKLKLLHELLSDKNVTGRELRRQFMEMTDKAGIDNKVVSFTALVAGRNDVLVMDRIQSRHLWDDGQFKGFNIYDGYRKGNTTAKEGLQGVMRGPRGLLVTELLEDGLRDNVAEAYKIAGRPGDASLGRFHWESWVIEGEQAVSHDTLASLKSGNPFGSSVTEGKRATISSGTTFIQTEKGMITEYPLSDGGSVNMSLTKQKEFESFIKKPKNGIMPSDFKISQSTDIPWYEQPGIDRSKLDAAAKKHANRRPDGTVLKSSGGTK